MKTTHLLILLLVVICFFFAMMLLENFEIMLGVAGVSVLVYMGIREEMKKAKEVQSTLE